MISDDGTQSEHSPDGQPRGGRGLPRMARATGCLPGRWRRVQPAAHEAVAGGHQ